MVSGYRAKSQVASSLSPHQFCAGGGFLFQRSGKP